MAGSLLALVSPSASCRGGALGLPIHTAFIAPGSATLTVMENLMDQNLMSNVSRLSRSKGQLNPWSEDSQAGACARVASRVVAGVQLLAFVRPASVRGFRCSFGFTEGSHPRGCLQGREITGGASPEASTTLAVGWPPSSRTTNTTTWVSSPVVSTSMSCAQSSGVTLRHRSRMLNRCGKSTRERPQPAYGIARSFSSFSSSQPSLLGPDLDTGLAGRLRDNLQYKIVST
jgi:hypothetical protein